MSIEQATLHKLTHVRALLKRKELASSGARDMVRARCISHVDDGDLSADELRGLLESLDLWGNQRIRLVHLADTELQHLQDLESVQSAIHHAGFVEIYQQELPLIIEPCVSPISIRYDERDEIRLLTLIAGKIQEDWVQVNSLPELPYESVAALLEQADIPDSRVVYRPFQLQRRRIVSFAEIDLDTGQGLISVKLTQSAGSYKTKYEEIFSAFDSLLHLSNAQRSNLSRAISRMDDPANQGHLHLPRYNLRGDQGERMRMEAPTGHGDVRQHASLRRARAIFTAEDSGDYSDCYWEPEGNLTERVHTYLYGSQGEIAFRGQASEESIRHVLQRVRHLNN